MTTPLDMPLDALSQAALEAAVKADAEARAAGLKPAGLLKRLRSRLNLAEPSPAKAVGRGRTGVGTKRRRSATGGVTAGRKLGG